MKLVYWISFLLVLIATLFFLYRHRQSSGSILRISFRSASLINNGMGENAERFLSIYLPKDYHKSDKRYPCLYFLHGFGVQDEYKELIAIKNLFDKAIESKIIPPLIVCFPNSYTRFRGSFYTNSDWAGKWADYIAIDVVKYMDSHYKTIDNRESRGISGHSMGGNGALKLSMLFPDVFSSVYALSPSILYWSDELVPGNPAFNTIQNAKSIAEVYDQNYPIGFLAMGSTYSANPNHPPFYCDMPVKYENGSMKLDSVIYNQWDKEFPLIMVDSHQKELNSLSGIGFDWGNKDEYLHIPTTCKALDKKLSAYHIPHFAEEYQGHHADKLQGMQGRIFKFMLPFFAQHIKP